MKNNKLKSLLAGVMALAMLCGLLVLPAPRANAEEIKTYGENLVFNGGTMDGILAEDETERTLNNDWGVSYPVATFGGAGGDSPAKIKNIDGNNVLVLEYTTGGFASYFADLYADGTTLPAGTYELSMDLKPVGDFATDNVGFHLYNQYTDIRIYDNGWQDCTEMEDGWLHYSKVFEIEEGRVDSIQMWCNTMGSSTLYIDNLSIALLEAEPEREELNAEYVAGSGVALNIAIPNAAESITVAEKAGYVLEAGLDYTYENGTLTLMNEYADGLASGKNDLIITAGDAEYKLRLIIRQAKPALPESSDGFLMQETLVGGDFEMFEEGFAFSLEQVEGWGSNISYDDPGVIVNQNGNKVLRLQKDQKSSYSSAFAFISPTIQAGDVLTFKFDYKLDVQDISLYQGADINLSFVSASNMQMLKIALDNSCPTQTTGDGDYQWDVHYTTLEDGWIRVEMTFVANTALLSYNSMRFLLPTDKAMAGDAMYVDNVSLVLWAEPEAPETISTDLMFNKAKPADVFALVDMQALDPQSITLNGAAVDSKHWSINPAKDTITFSKDYLATLANGEQTFTITTAGGSCEVVITVTGEAANAGQNTNTNNNNNDQQNEPAGNWIWIVVACAAVVAVIVIVVIVRKKK